MEQNKKIKRVAIVGVGLIGGSFALTLKEKGIAEEVIGVDNSENNRNKALELKLVDRFEELHQAVKDADLIVIETKGTQIIEPELFASKAKFSPFAGQEVKGKVIYTIVGGKIVS